MSFITMWGNPHTASLPQQKVVASTAPVYSSSEIGSVDNNTVVLTHSKAIVSPLADYVTGYTIKINGVGDTITAGVRANGNLDIKFTLTTFVDHNDVTTIEYSSAAGDIEDVATSTALATFGAMTVTDNVGNFVLSAPGNAAFLLLLYEV